MPPLKEGTVSEIRPASRARLRQLREALEAVREIDGDLTAGQILTLIEVALSPGTTVSNIGQRLGVQLSTVSRNADIVGTYGRQGKKGLGLVERRPDPEDRRVKGLYLTAKGVRAVTRMLGGDQCRDS